MELMESTAVNGYVELEPLFVVDELETVGVYAKAPFASDPGLDGHVACRPRSLSHHDHVPET